MRHPLISIVINNHNYAHFLCSAIDSALGQTYAHTEVIVVDDGSTDGSQELILDYQGRIGAVLKENGGQASACNAGFSCSRGDVVIFLDADDLLLPDTAEVIAAGFDWSEVVKVHWPLWTINAAGARTGSVIPNAPLGEGAYREQVIQHGLIDQANSPMSGNAWSRQFLQQVLPIAEPGNRHGADAYLCLLALVFGPIGRTTRPLGCYRVHADNYSRLSWRALAQRDLRYFDCHWPALRRHLSQMGHSVETTTWTGPNSYYTWLCNLLISHSEIVEVIPAGATVILVDGGQLSNDFASEYHRIPFLARGGSYWGLPEEDGTAIREVEAIRLAGAQFMIFIETTFWILENYPLFCAHLRKTYRSVLESQRTIIFEICGNT